MNIVLFRKKVEGVRLTKPSDDLNVYKIYVLWATIFIFSNQEGLQLEKRLL